MLRLLLRIILLTTRRLFALQSKKLNTESQTVPDGPYKVLNHLDVLAIDDVDNLDFVWFTGRYIHPDKEHDNHVNELLERAKAWVTLEHQERQHIITGTFLDLYRGQDLFQLDTNGNLKLLQYPLLQTSHFARVDLLQTFYKDTLFLCVFNLRMGGYHEPVLGRTLQSLGPTRSSALFSLSLAPAIHLAIRYRNLGSAITMHGIYQWVLLFLDGPFSRHQLETPGKYDHWSFDANMYGGHDPTAEESALEYFLVGLQEVGRRLGRRLPAKRGDWREAVLQWTTDYDKTADGSMKKTTTSGERKFLGR